MRAVEPRPSLRIRRCAPSLLHHRPPTARCGPPPIEPFLLTISRDGDETRPLLRVAGVREGNHQKKAPALAVVDEKPQEIRLNCWRLQEQPQRKQRRAGRAPPGPIGATDEEEEDPAEETEAGTWLALGRWLSRIARRRLQFRREEMKGLLPRTRASGSTKKHDDDDDDYDDDDYFLHRLREWRHDPCLMRPVSALVLFVMLLFGLVTTVLKFPTFLLSFLLGGVIHRFHWVIEFLYPTSLGKWIHLTMAEYVSSKGRMNNGPSRPSSDKNRGHHSRTAEQRIEVVPHEVYIHPLPQFMDNLGYLIVVVVVGDKPSPLPVSSPSSSSYYSVDDKESKTPDDEMRRGEGATAERNGSSSSSMLVGILVDCGQWSAVEAHLELIQTLHYPTHSKIRIDAIWSTHKHHDHTGANLALLAKASASATQVSTSAPRAARASFAVHPDLAIVGGAVEKVPGCNVPVSHGDVVPLPSAFKALVDVRAVCAPAHTRGSITYVLRPLKMSPSQSRHHGVAYLFTGDTVFCGGSGVPFEADADTSSRDRPPTPHSLIRATSGSMAMERCFAEILYQCSDVKRDGEPQHDSKSASTSFDAMSRGSFAQVPTDRIVVLPGHEYTNELLMRQLVPQNALESCKWKNFSPNYFFETASHLLVSVHRRSLPHSSGRLVSAMSTLRRELLVNPQFRMLRKRGDAVLRSLQHWHRHFAKVKVPSTAATPAAAAQIVDGDSTPRRLFREESNHVDNSNSKQWSLFATDLDRPVFTTVYSADLSSIIGQLSSGQMDPVTAAQHLADMRTVMDLPAVGRRPIPDTLPSNRSIGRSLVAICLLGSPPAALTLSDSLALKLPPPVVGKSSDKILISKSRLLRVLHVLGLVRDEDHYERISAMLTQLWTETKEYSDAMSAFNPKPPSGSIQTVTYDAVDVEVEVRTPSDDQVSLGALRWVMFGVPRAAPFLSQWKSCLPCTSRKAPPSETDVAMAKLHDSHPIHTCGLRQHSGELVRHDLQTCLFCISLTGSHGVLPPRDEDDDANGELERQNEWDALHGGAQSDTVIFSPPSPSSPLATTDATARRALQRASSSTSLEEPPMEEAAQHMLNELLCEASLETLAVLCC